MEERACHKMSLTPEAVQIWIAAIEQNYIESLTWVSWAEVELQRASPVPPWLVDLYEATDPNTALQALFAGMRNLCQETSNDWPHDHVSLSLGVMWLRYERGDWTLAELLARAGQVADFSNYDSPPCESLYALLSELDGTRQTNPDALPIAGRVARCFEAHATLARRLLSDAMAEHAGVTGLSPDAAHSAERSPPQASRDPRAGQSCRRHTPVEHTPVRARLIRSNGPSHEAVIEIDGRPYCVMDDFSWSQEHSPRLGETFDVELSATLDETWSWETIFSANPRRRIGLESAGGCSYLAFGRIRSIAPVQVDCGVYIEERLLFTHDERVVGEFVGFRVETLYARIA